MGEVKPGWQPAVYFLVAAGSGLVKIGWVRHRLNVRARIEQLQPGCPYTLIEAFVLAPASRIDEGRVHRRFMPLHHRGEFFRCEGDLRTLLQLGAADPDAAGAWLRAEIGVDAEILGG
jgi:hypothetical protein